MLIMYYSYIHHSNLCFDKLQSLSYFSFDFFLFFKTTSFYQFFDHQVLCSPLCLRYKFLNRLIQRNCKYVFLYHFYIYRFKNSALFYILQKISEPIYYSNVYSYLQYLIKIILGNAFYLRLTKNGIITLKFCKL